MSLGCNGAGQCVALNREFVCRLFVGVRISGVCVCSRNLDCRVYNERFLCSDKQNIIVSHRGTRVV